LSTWGKKIQLQIDHCLPNVFWLFVALQNLARLWSTSRSGWSVKSDFWFLRNTGQFVPVPQIAGFAGHNCARQGFTFIAPWISRANLGWLWSSWAYGCRWNNSGVEAGFAHSLGNGQEANVEQSIISLVDTREHYWLLTVWYPLQTTSFLKSLKYVFRSFPSRFSYAILLNIF